MRLFTNHQYQQLLKNGSRALLDQDHYPVVKLFTPDAHAQWLITQIDPDDTNTAFGLCDLGLGVPELGYIDLMEVMRIRGSRGLLVKRDSGFMAEHPISIYAHAARMNSAITEDATALALARSMIRPR